MKTIKITFIIPMLFTLLVLGCKNDDLTVVNSYSPKVTLTNPLDNVTEVPPNQEVIVTFSEAMDELTINATTFTLKQGTNSIAGSVSYSGTSATFTPTSNLKANSSFTGIITTGAKNWKGSALNANYSFGFTTGNILDIILPAVTQTDPINGATNVAHNKAIQITLSEAMMTSSINSTTFSLAQGTTSVPNLISHSGTTTTFTRTIALSANTSHTTTIPSMTGITLKAGATLNDRELAQIAVVLDGNTVIKP